MVAKVVIEAMTDIEVETPSGKGAADENFPVGSWLLPAALRPHVATYYAFARAIDDIADNLALAPEDQVARMSALEAALLDAAADGQARKSVVEGKSVSVRVDLGGRRNHKKQTSRSELIYATKRQYQE